MKKFQFYCFLKPRIGISGYESCFKRRCCCLGDKGKVIKIDVDKNQQLSEALKS